MLQNIILIVILCYKCGQSSQTNKTFLLKLTPEQVLETFDGVMSDDYIKILAKDFAAKAAAHFMKEIRYQKNSIAAKLNSEREEKTYRKQQEQQQQDSLSESVEVDSVKAKPVKFELGEKEAMSLLEEPSPDGDHMDSSGEFSDDEKKTIPVIQVTKINGKYFRRLLGMI